MRLADWARAHPFETAGILGLALGAGLGLLWPVKVPPASQREAESWAPPAGLEAMRPKESEFTTVRDAPIWGSAGAPGAKSGDAARATWRLTGIIEAPWPAVLVQVAGEARVTPVRVGEQLPDGAQVKRILEGGVRYTREGCTYDRMLYAAVEVPDGTCANQAAAEEEPRKK